MEHHNSQNASILNNEIRTRLRSSSPSDQASIIDNVHKDDDTSGKRGRKSSLSAIVGSIGTRLKRSTSSVTSSTDGRISNPNDNPGNLSTPTKRKNSATSKIPSEPSSVQSPSRRSSTPIDQRIDTSVSTSKGKKTSLRGIFSSARKFSLQTNSNGADQLPPRPPPSVKASYQDTQSAAINVGAANEPSSNQPELLGRHGEVDAWIRNGTNGSIPKHTRSQKYSAEHTHSSSHDNNTFIDRRARIHKHSLQQGNKWKLLQQKVLGNVDEENDDEQECPTSTNYGKMFGLTNDNLSNDNCANDNG